MFKFFLLNLFLNLKICFPKKENSIRFVSKKNLIKNGYNKKKIYAPVALFNKKIASQYLYKCKLYILTV